MSVPGQLGWLGIARLGLVQAALGSVVVLTTSTFNRVMVVELSLAAVLPGLLVAAHYAIQILRPRFGHGSDTGGRRTPWIVGGMIVLALGGTLAAIAIALAERSVALGLALSLLAYLMIGAGVGACGTSLLVLLAEYAAPERRAAAATITWVMMIVGFIVTTLVVGSLLDPFSMERLITLTAAVGTLAVVLSVLASAGIEQCAVPIQASESDSDAAAEFSIALKEVLSEPRTRRFGFFVFMSMLAYSAQDLLVEPFAGALFGFTPGESTQLGGVQHSGVLLGMVLVGLVGTWFGKGRQGPLRLCMISGCLGSAAMLVALALAAWHGGEWPLVPNLFALGLANGVFAVAAIGSMMSMVSDGHENRDGVRMGVWGAAQAVAFGLGGVLGTALVDVARWLNASLAEAYALAFLLQAGLFVAATLIAVSLSRHAAPVLTTAVRTDPLNRVAG